MPHPFSRMELEPDRRIFSAPEERFSTCPGCGTDLVVLPNDRRHGLCFDCSMLEPQ